jgi:hypothetical protein
MKREYTNITQKSIQYHICEVKVKLLHISFMYQSYKLFEAKSLLEKINND